MGWPPADYAEKSRRLSLLKALQAEVFSTWVPDLTSVANQFRIIRPIAEFARPAAVCLKISGQRTGGVGGLKRKNLYQLLLYPKIEASDSEAAEGEAALDLWGEQIIDWLHGKMIPFYDYSTGTAARLKDWDFKCEYEADRKGPEPGVEGRVVLVVEFSVEV